MRKLIINLSIILLTIITLTSCASNNIDLRISGYNSNYIVGDTFSTEGLVVLNNGENVTGNVEIDSSAVDMTKPGSYAVIVKYEGFEKAYYITVSVPDNTKTLKSLDVDLTNVRQDFIVGETFSYDGLALIATYANSNGEDTTEYLTDLTGFNIEVRDLNNNVITDSFEEEGTYNVYISQGNVNTSYEINVTLGANSIDVAINAAITNSHLVAGGTSINSEPSTNQLYGRTTTDYSFGDNLLSLSYTYQNNRYIENYFTSSDTNSVIGVRVNRDYNEGSTTDPDYSPYNVPLETLDGISSNNLLGLDYSIAAGTRHYYGPEALLQGLYELAINNPNYDYTETITKSYENGGEVEYIYNFSFGLLEEMQTTTVFYFNVIDVTFTLGSGNFLETLTVTNDLYVVSELRVDFIITPKGEPNSQIFYAADRVLPDGSLPGSPNSGYDSDFPVLTEQYGIGDCMARLKGSVSPSTHYSNSYQISQYVGERTAVNEYPESEIYVLDYDIKDYNTGALITDYTFDILVDSDNNPQSLMLQLDGFNSETAKQLDVVNVWYNGVNYGTFSQVGMPGGAPNDGTFTLYYSTSRTYLRLRLHRVGTFEFELRTEKTVKTITVNVDYQAPTSLTTQVYRDDPNPEYAIMLDMNTTTCFVGDTIYFRAVPNSVGDPEYISTCDSNLSHALVDNPFRGIPEGIVHNGYEYFSSFMAMEAGTYVITMKSNRNNVSTTLTINVLDEPDYSQIITGTYYFRASDVPNSAFVVGSIEFTINSSNANVLIGEAVIKIGNDINETISFTYQNREFSNVGHIEGSQSSTLGLSLGLTMDENSNAQISITLRCAYLNEDGSVKYSTQAGGCVLSKDPNSFDTNTSE